MGWATRGSEEVPPIPLSIKSALQKPIQRGADFQAWYEVQPGGSDVRESGSVTEDSVSDFWVIEAANLLLIIPLFLLFIHSVRRTRTVLRQAEEERNRIADNERRLRRIWEAEPQGIVVLGLDYRILQVNPAGCLLFDAGFAEEIVGRDVRELIQSDDRRLIDEMYQASHAGREACGTGRVIGLSGQIRWIDSIFAPLPADDGTVQSVLAVVRDVTDHKRAELRQALQHAVAKVLAEAATVEQAIPELLQAITMNLHWQVGLFWIVREDQRTIACVQDWSLDTPMAQEVRGASRERVYGSGQGLPGRCWERGEPLWVEDVANDPAYQRGAGAEGGSLRTACAFPIWLRANVFGVMEFYSEGRPVQDWDLLKMLGTVGSQIGLFVERTEVEAALHESEARTRLIIDTALDAVITTDCDGRISEWNAQAERIFGWSIHEVIGRDLADTILSPASRPAYARHCEGLRASQDPSVTNKVLELVGIRQNDQEFPIELATTPLQVEGVIIFSAFVRDISARKVAEHALKEYAQQLEAINQQLDVALREAKAATEAKSSFLATMSHEIRTPMNGVIGMTGLLLETPMTEEQREYAETVRICGEHLLTVINDILDFSKIEAGKLDLEVIDFDLRIAVEDSLELLAERASVKGINLACLFHADVPRDLLGDPGRLRQVVMNLVANAVKFTDGGDVVVEVTADAQSEVEATIRVTVTDTGIGIAEDVCNRLFQAFSQADGSTTRKYGGTGLGLAICKRLVELMGGTIGVRSQVGRGSCFWFTVNMQKQAGVYRRVESTAPVLAGQRVLIVNEKPINRKMFDLMLRKWGMRPVLVSSGSEALNMLSVNHGEGAPFDLALLDVDGEATSGIDLARTIKNRVEGASLPLILLTSVGRRGDAKAAKEAGLAAYLTKPVREQQLYDCLITVTTQRATSSTEEGVRVPSPLVTRHTLAETKAKVDLRILLAEDNLINQKVAARLFQRLGHRLDVVANGREAIEALARVHYDLVFMDCQMPEMDGFEATRLIREREASSAAASSGPPVSGSMPMPSSGLLETSCQTPDIPSRVPIIAMTANAMQGDRERCIAAGMDEYLAKPISIEALAGVLNRVNPACASSRPNNNREAA